MREIKFRAWNKETGEMVDLQSITPFALDANMNAQLAMKVESGLFIPFCDGLLVMQYTGLKDFNGSDVYEGDILDEKYKCPVEFRSGCFVLGNASGGGAAGRKVWDFLAKRTQAGCEPLIIGNIHENPELLKVVA